MFQADHEMGDVAAGLIDEAAFYPGGDIVIDEDRVAALVALVVPQSQDDPLSFTCTPVFPGPRTAEVTCAGRTELLFTPTSGTVVDMHRVSASARATARTG